ncbi:peptidoglycan-associated lipoprotein Pal [Qingshengfaniella alkalisoli]|uniref:Peptidoglycan-associated lipoprotein n=1 Tax=Qingshengfaniella alkalisoli TaxID=2599296 RepID=A0A5B8IXZ3_9RHOB|nr:peptidoglycan-associated lipoprotein Pal [Qingshengfaniella alkalisoli]QDY69528.1 peptidoglycan-associated lipoprotein Pal [Qingshengfaniella alkalisoli]
MNRKTTAILFLAALAVSACSNSRFGQGNEPGAYGANGAYGSGAYGDPRSPEYFQQAVGDRVLFSVDESTLNPAARATLAEQARWLMTNGSYNATIEGHADEQGTREYNIALGARRANAVQEYLVTQGVAPSRLKTISYGKERPLEICSEEACYAKNRRAVTVLSLGAGS